MAYLCLLDEDMNNAGIASCAVCLSLTVGCCVKIPDAGDCVTKTRLESKLKHMCVHMCLRHQKSL